MGFAFVAHETKSSFTTGDIVSDGIAVQAGDVIVVSVGVNSQDRNITGITDSESNSYTLRDELERSSTSQRNGYVLSANGAATITVTGTFSDATAATKRIEVAVFRPDGGDTVSFDIAGTFNAFTSGGVITTSSDTTTGDDEVAVAFIMSNGARTYTNQEIPAATAADGVFTSDNSNTTGFYRILSATVVGLDAQSDVGSAGHFVAELLTFKSVSGGATFEVTAADGIAAADAPGAALTIVATVADGLTGADAPAGPLTLAGLAADGVDLADTVGLANTILGSVADGIVVADAATGALTISAQVADGTSFSDAVSAIFTYLATVNDGIKLSDVAIDSSITAQGLVTVTFTTAAASVTITTAQPGAGLTGNKPDVEFS